MTKYDEGEVAVNEEDELAVGFWSIFSHIFQEYWGNLLYSCNCIIWCQVRMFMKPNRETRTRTLGEIINEKMTEKKTEIQSQFSDGTELMKVNLSCRDDSSTVDWVGKFWNFHNLTLNCIFDSTNPLSGYQPSGERDVHRGGCPAHPLQVRQGAQGLQDASTGCLLYLSLKVVSHGPFLPLDNEILSSGTGNNFCTWLNLRNGQPQQCTRWLDIFHNIQVWFVQCYPLLWWSL